MNRIPLFICTMFLYVIGCQTADSQHQSAQDAETVVTLKSSHSSKKRRLDRRSALKNEVVTAVKYALSLEKQLFAHGSAFKSKKQVYQHYRQGFGPNIAKKLTEYSWSGGEMGLKPGDPTIEPPKIVEVSQINANKAVAYYKTPKWQREVWGTEKFTVVKLKREKGRWVIWEAKGANSLPWQ
jgi:hypothetical protein